MNIPSNLSSMPWNKFRDFAKSKGLKVGKRKRESIEDELRSIAETDIGAVVVEPKGIKASSITFHVVNATRDSRRIIDADQNMVAILRGDGIN